jgi:hypothetical protein
MTEYKLAIKEHGWKIRLLTESVGDSVHVNIRTIRDNTIPPFSPATFLEHLVNFIVADDQVSSIYLTFSLFLGHQLSGSLFASLNALNSESCVCSSVSLSSTPTFLVVIK